MKNKLFESYNFSESSKAAIAKVFPEFLSYSDLKIIKESQSLYDEYIREFSAKVQAEFPELGQNDYEILCYEEDGEVTFAFRVYDKNLAHSPEFKARIEKLMSDYGCINIEQTDLPDEPDWTTWYSMFNG